MGAWGHGPFENDSALDWLLEAESVDAEQAILGAFEAVHELEYVEVDEGSAVVAAATIVAAALRGEPLAAPAGAVRMAAELRPTPELRSLGVRALDVVLADRSELAELRADGDGDEWRSDMNALREALERG